MASSGGNLSDWSGNMDAAASFECWWATEDVLKIAAYAENLG
jgi:hypothetical protein